MSLEEIAAELRIGIEDVRRFLDIERPSFPLEPEPDGNVEDFELVEDFEEEEPARSDVAVAVQDYLERKPHRADKTTSWISNTLWACELYPSSILATRYATP